MFPIGGLEENDFYLNKKQYKTVRMNYTNGKIYKIWNNINNEIYIGSTCQLLSKRMAEHRSNRMGEQKRHRPLYKLMNELGVEHFFIELLIDCPCENIEELRKIEGEYIRQYGTLNIIISGRTGKEWRKENSEKIVERVKNGKKKI